MYFVIIFANNLRDTLEGASFIITSNTLGIRIAGTARAKMDCFRRSVAKIEST